MNLLPHSFERKDFHEKCSGVLATSESKGAGDAGQRTSSITIRRLAATRRNLAAAPGYLDVHSSPSSIDELANPRGNASRSARLEEVAQFMQNTVLVEPHASREF